MSIFGGLFGHDKKSARATGAYQEPTSLPPLPGMGLQGDLGSGLNLPNTDRPRFQADSLPTPPPPVKRPGAFDDAHRRDTLLQMSAGFFGANGMGNGLANAAQIIASQNAAARAEARPQYGGPDNAFEVTTDPQTGQRTYKAVPEITGYLHQKAEDAAALKIKGPTPEGSLDAIGRLTSVVSQFRPEEQAAAWATGREQLAALGFDGVPETFRPEYTAFGASVPKMIQAETGQKRHAETMRHNGVMEGQGATRVVQGGERINLAREAVRRNGGGKGGKVNVSSTSTADLLDLLRSF
jgi:hypothetical protein